MESVFYGVRGYEVGNLGYISLFVAGINESGSSERRRV